MVESLVSGAGVLLLLAGCTIATIGLYGLIVKPDLFEQLHVAGLVSGPGVILVLLASIGTGSAEIMTSAILVIAFVLVTSSVSTHVIAQAGVRRYGRGPADARARPDLSRIRAPGRVEARRPEGTGMRVVVALDDSPGALAASDLVVAIDWPDGTIVRLVAVGEGEPTELDPWRGAHARADGSDTASPARPELAVPSEALRRRGLVVETAFLVGDPADLIAQETAAFEADLLVTGSRRRGLVSSVLGLSATGEIVDRAPCPVLVARSAAVREVMLTTDGSSPSAAAAELVARWPIFDLTRIRVVTVATGSSGPGAGRGSTTGRPSDELTADATAAVLMDAGRDVVTEVLYGKPAERIVEAAAERAIDLIVIGSRGRTGLGRTLLGSVAGEVLASAQCSVLIVGPPMRRPPSS